MSNVDSFEFLLNNIARDLRNINDTFALFGIYYTAKLAIRTSFNIISGLKTYLIPQLISNDSWIKSLGDWAIIAGCSNGIGVAYANELAKRGINIILIDKNHALVDKLADELSIKLIFMRIII